jgi:glucuronoarabinoxylan endo-1,4-beta-xylanase
LKRRLSHFTRGASPARLALVASLLGANLAAGCVFRQKDKPTDEGTEPIVQPETEPSGTIDITVDLTKRFQRIAGFGASSAWTAPSMGEERADEFFDVDTGIGLSLLRIQIKPDGTSTEIETVDRAVERGVRVWAAPWSPPAAWKDNNSTINGGSLLVERYQDWADSLADFALEMQDRGTPLFGISAQNEPDYSNTWDTCIYTPVELATFVGEHLAPALQERKVETKIIAPEAANWNSIERFSEALLNHETATDHLLAFATHGYAGEAFTLDSVVNDGHELWQTEISDPDSSTPDVGIDSALRVVKIMHRDLTVGLVSAWHYWWLHARGDVNDTNAALADRDYQLTKRAYAMGQFSKFVRPGALRVNVDEPKSSTLLTTAYLSEDEERLIVVVINSKGSKRDLKFNLPDRSERAAEYWRTSASSSLERRDDVRVAGGIMDVQVDAKSINTFVVSLVDEPIGAGGAGGASAQGGAAGEGNPG